MGLNATQKAAIVATVIGGTLLFAGRNKNRKCKDFDGVWSKKGASGGLYLTRDAREEAFSWTRSHMASLLVSGESFSVENVTLDLANYIQECEWEDVVETKRGKQVWSSLSKIVDSVLSEINIIGEDEFVREYGGD